MGSQHAYIQHDYAIDVIKTLLFIYLSIYFMGVCLFMLVGHLISYCCECPFNFQSIYDFLYRLNTHIHFDNCVFLFPNVSDEITNLHNYHLHI
jgi:hypothetical protein